MPYEIVFHVDGMHTVKNFVSRTTQAGQGRNQPTDRVTNAAAKCAAAAVLTLGGSKRRGSGDGAHGASAKKRQKKAFTSSQKKKVEQKARLYAAGRADILRMCAPLVLTPVQQELASRRFLRVVDAAPREAFDRSRLPYTKRRWNCLHMWHVVRFDVLPFIFRGLLPRGYVRALREVSQIIRLAIDGPVLPDLVERSALALARLELHTPVIEHLKARHDIYHLVSRLYR
jgi:hypothetical protein